MTEEWYNQQWHDEREELADLEYSDPLVPIDEDEDETPICTCEIDPDFCEVHKIEDEDEE